MVVLPYTCASRYNKRCTDGSTSPEYFGHALLLLFGSSSQFFSHPLSLRLKTHFFDSVLLVSFVQCLFGAW
jgi:hypothetical protein